MEITTEGVDTVRVSLSDTISLYMLDYGHISWEEYAETVPPENRPPEYIDMVHWLKNRGKVTRRDNAEWELSGQED